MISVKSEIFRIAGNYLRMAIGFVIGVFVVRQLLYYGEQVFNIYTIVTVGAGVTIMLRELLRIAFLPALSRYWTRKKYKLFSRIYSTNFTVSAIAFLIGMLAMATLAYSLPYISVSKEYISSGQIYIACRAGIMLTTILLAPLFTMQATLQRFSENNLMLTLERAMDLIAVILPAFLLTQAGNGQDALIIFGVVSLILTILLHLFFAMRLIKHEPKLLPHLTMNLRAVPKTVWHSIGWATLLVISFNLYLRFDTIFINTTFGTQMTVAFGITVQLVGIVRQISYGMSNGLDAVLAKLALSKQSDRSRQLSSSKLMEVTTYLQSISSGYAILVIIAAGPQLISLWVGDRVSSNSIIHTAASLSAVMLIGMAARAISESWMSSLNGAGNMNSYVKLILPLTLINPIVLIILSLSHGKIEIMHVAYIFSGLLIVSHLLLVPMAYSKVNAIAYHQILEPVVRSTFGIASAGLLLWLVTPLLEPLQGILHIAAICVIVACIAGLDLVHYALKFARKKNPA